MEKLNVILHKQLYDDILLVVLVWMAQWVPLLFLYRYQNFLALKLLNSCSGGWFNQLCPDNFCSGLNWIAPTIIWLYFEVSCCICLDFSLTLLVHNNCIVTFLKNIYLLINNLLSSSFPLNVCQCFLSSYSYFLWSGNVCYFSLCCTAGTFLREG